MKRLVKVLMVLALGALICLPGMAMAELVVNGGFETGDFTGWTTSRTPDNSFLVWSGAAHSGNYGAFFGAMGGSDDTIMQIELPTVAGSSYTFDFWLAHSFPGVTGEDNDFHASWNGSDVLTLSNDGGFYWTEYTFTVVAPGDISTIAFAGREVPAGYFLDDVSVTDPVPLPPSALLLGSGLLGLVGLRWRRVRARV